LEEFQVSQGVFLGLLDSEIQGFEDSSETQGFELVLEMVIEVHAATSFAGAKYPGGRKKL
jgi:hypothetical protein